MIPAAPGDSPFVGTDDETDDGIGDDELTALALAADPDTPVADDAVCLAGFFDSSEAALLPSWYMPQTSGPRMVRGWRRRLSLLIVASFILINAYGLCSTYGQVVPA
ncbi:MAG: hypothetical protein ABIW46_06615 [Acidimicrobiales bacterium]